MTRSRSVVLGSTLVVIVGALTAVGAIYLSPARAAVGPLPAEGLVLPADTRFVVGLDVKRLMASELYTSRSGRRPLRPEAFADLEAKTGINPERDLDQVVIAGGPSAGTGRHGTPGIVLVSGRFDRYKLSRAMETTRKDVTWKDHQGTTVYMFGEGRKGADAAAFLDDDTLVFGGQAAVEETISSRAEGKAPLRTNASLMALLERVKPGSAFWMVGDQSLLANLPRSIPAPGGDGSGLQLPAVRTLVVTGDLDPQIALDLTAETADEAAARNLADVVRGLTALAALQGNQKPELKELASAVSVTTEVNQVHVSARISHALFESLQPKKVAESPGVAR